MGIEQTLARPEPFLARGQTWQLAPVTPGLRARFSAFVKKQALEELASLKSSLSAPEYHEVQSAVLARLASGACSWGTPLNPKGMGAIAREVYESDNGMLYLLQLLLEKQHGKVELEELAKLVEDNPAGFKGALRTAHGLPPEEAAGEGTDPNVPPPSLTTRTTTA